MPIYEYRCLKCGFEFEAIRKFSDGPLRKAPDCPKDRTCKLEKLVSASAFHLKGGGWYDDGYGGGAKKKKKVASKAAEGGKKATASPGSDKKKSPTSEPKKSAKKDS